LGAFPQVLAIIGMDVIQQLLPAWRLGLPGEPVKLHHLRRPATLPSGEVVLPNAGAHPGQRQPKPLLVGPDGLLRTLTLGDVAGNAENGLWHAARVPQQAAADLPDQALTG